MQRKAAAMLISAFLLFPGPSLNAQAEVAAAMTIGQIRSLLHEALVSLQQAAITAGGEVKGAGNSLQANVQNVIDDIDARFGKRLNFTIDKLEGAERLFMTDARDLIFKTREAARVATADAGSEARRAIGEADIAAYNALYSLPCRTQIPRVVYVTPAEAIAKGEEMLVTLQGNFLNVGDGAKVYVNGIPSRDFTRSDRAISVKLKRDLIRGIRDTTAVDVRVLNLKKRTLEPRILSTLFGCSESFQVVPESSVSVTLKPRIHYRVQGDVWGSFEEWSPEFEFQRGEINRRDDNCDHNEDISLPVCVPADRMRVTRSSSSTSSKSGPSSFDEGTRSGENCILFRGRLAGSGYNEIFGQRTDCRGSAWLHTSWVVYAQQLDPKESQRKKFDEHLSIGRYSYAVNNAQPIHGENWKWRFITTIEQRRGSQVLASETLTDGRADNGRGWIATMRDGVLTITLPNSD